MNERPGIDEHDAGSYLVLWSDYEVAVVGSIHDIRALFTRALALLPHDSEGRHS